MRGLFCKYASDPDDCVLPGPLARPIVHGYDGTGTQEQQHTEQRRCFGKWALSFSYGCRPILNSYEAHQCVHFFVEYIALVLHVTE